MVKLTSPSRWLILFWNQQTIGEWITQHSCHFGVRVPPTFNGCGFDSIIQRESSYDHIMAKSNWTSPWPRGTYNFLFDSIRWWRREQVEYIQRSTHMYVDPVSVIKQAYVNINKWINEQTYVLTRITKQTKKQRKKQVRYKSFGSLYVDCGS
jgi:hypothetical protein